MKVATGMWGGDAAHVIKLAARHIIEQLQQPRFMAVFASTQQSLPELLQGMSQRFPGCTVIGCSTSGEFCETGDEKGHTSIFAVSGDFEVRAGIGKQLREDAAAAVHKATAELPRSMTSYPHRTAIVLLDALAGVSEETTLLIADALGFDTRLAGGAAGDDLKMQAPLVGLKDNIDSNAIVVAMLYTRAPLGVGVCHGHRELSQPLTITKARGATVFEVDGQPALDVWKSQTRAAAHARGIDVDTIAPAQLGGYLLQFEAGLLTEGAAKIRAPLSANPDGSLNFACGLPEGSVVRITESDAGSQVASARTAAASARAHMGGGRVAGALVFDCICRNLILGPRFKDAVAAMHQALGAVPIAGFESYGEVALDAGDFSGFHNTTTVVLAFPEEA